MLAQTLTVYPYNVLELAFDAGFNSKSTFNAVFKREVGMTPTQFVKNIPL